jgi:hypothetical protein
VARENLSRFLRRNSQSSRRSRTQLLLEPMEDRITPAITVGINSLPATVGEGTAVTVSAATDAGTPTFDWSVTQNGSELFSGTANTFSFTPADDGTFTVSLTVTGTDPANPASTLTQTATQTLAVTNVAPTVTVPADATIDAGATFTGQGSVTDPGTADVFKATVDYGDGTGIQNLTLNPGNTFDLSHIYVGTGTFTVTVTVLDNGGGTGTGTFTVTVANAAPVVTVPADVALDEGEAFTGGGSFTDAGTGPWTATVDYGDGTGVQTLTLNDDKTFTLDHAFVDDGTFTVTVAVTDEAGAVGTASFVATVANVAPTASISGPTVGVRGMQLSYTLTATDPSSADTAAGFTFAIDWNGDGTVDETVDGPSGTVVTHTFNELGTNTIIVTATDKNDATSDPAQLTVEIKVAALMDDPLNPGHKLLAVGGSDGNDSILINPSRGLQVLVDGVSVGRFQGAERIAVFGGDGNDTIRLAGAIRISAWLDGGAGDDILKGAKGNDVLEGGEGNDQLQGAQGQDILVGGLGADSLNGGPGQDILIGGQLMLEDADLFSVNQTWSGGGAFDSRVDSLRTGDAALTVGTDGTVQNDGEVDRLQGAAGRNWFFADTLTDVVLGNKKTSIIDDFDSSTDPVVGTGKGNGNGGNGNGGGAGAGTGGNGNGGGASNSNANAGGSGASNGNAGGNGNGNGNAGGNRAGNGNAGGNGHGNGKK